MVCLYTRIDLSIRMYHTVQYDGAGLDACVPYSCVGLGIFVAEGPVWAKKHARQLVVGFNVLSDRHDRCMYAIAPRLSVGEGGHATRKQDYNGCGMEQSMTCCGGCVLFLFWERLSKPPRFSRFVAKNNVDFPPPHLPSIPGFVPQRCSSITSISQRP